MKSKAIVLGCGMIGATMARDLAATGFTVTGADLDESNRRKLDGMPGVQTLKLDFTNHAALKRAIEPFDVVLGALPSRFAFDVLRVVIEAGKPYCDISFMPEDALAHDTLAKKHNVPAIVDCGVSPGLSNLLVGRAAAVMDEVREAVIYVGGLPKVRTWPHQYKAPFAPSDVIEEYTRPARLVQNGRVVTKPALTDRELIDFPRVGTLEAFNTDGLRSLLTTVRIPNMREKTLRYPGHTDLMHALREIGLFRQDEVDVRGTKVRPRDLIATLMFPQWKLDEGEEEFTVLRVEAIGGEKGKPVRRRWDLYDEYDHESGTTSMARTTAFPSVIAAQLVADGRIKQVGVLPPEKLADDDHIFTTMIEELRKRGVTINESVEALGEA